MKIFFNPQARCLRCDRGISVTRHVAFYMVGSRAAIAYMLCNACGPKTPAELPPAELRKLEEKLEAQAKSLGLIETH